MKNLLQNLLICFALCLCALLAWQWTRETGLRNQTQALSATLRAQSQTIQKLQSQLRRDEAEIQRLDALKTDFAASAQANQDKIANLTQTLQQAMAEKDKTLNQLARFKDALQAANTNITRQNDQMKQLADDRNALAQKFNKLAADYTGLVNKWNRQQETLAKAATNAPPKQ